jgi:hypothetical protein
LADLFVFGVAPIDYSPILLLMPFGFQIALDTLPSGTRATGTRSALAVSGFRLRARLGFSIPPCFPGQRGITPAFGYGAPHPSAEGTSTPLTHALPSTHYGFLCNRRRQDKLARCRQLLGMANVVPATASGTSGDYRDVYEALSDKSLRRCPSCDDGRLLVIKVLPRPNNRQWVCDTS